MAGADSLPGGSNWGLSRRTEEDLSPRRNDRNEFVTGEGMLRLRRAERSLPSDLR
jgi:hypothetical protein